MNRIALKLIFGHLVAVIAVTLLTVMSVQTANAAIIFQNDDLGDFASDGIILDVDDQATDSIMIQFGTTIAETIKWSIGNARFEISNNVDLTNHQLTTARMENVAALPGGAPGLGAGGLGRFVVLTAIDSTAPGCTPTSCNPGSYVWNGTAWEKMSTATSQAGGKIVTVGATGRDYTTVADAATYLNSGSGGEIWLDPGSHSVITSVDLANIKIRGADSSASTIAITVDGILLVENTKFKDVAINVDSGITADMGLDAKYNAASSNTLEFEQIDFIVGAGKFLIDSTEGTAPTLSVQMENCLQTSGTGNLVKAKASANLNAASIFKVLDQAGVNSLKLQDWDVTVSGGGNVSTSGTITSIPDRIIEVSPGMNIQSAINSLGSGGGTVKLLVGTHALTDSIIINNNNISLTGEGPSTILTATSATWVGGVTNNDAVINVGATNGTSPRSNVVVRNLKLNIEPNIHGIQVNGGTEIKIIDNFIESTGAKSNARVGLLFTDGAASAGSRFTSAKNYISSSAAGTRWVDGVHFDGNGDIAGQLFGYGNGIQDSIISETIVTQAQETSFAFSQVSASSVFSNRARDLAISAGAFGMFFNDCTDVMVINNTMEGASASATGISLYDNVDNSVFLGNAVRGGPTNFTVGIDIMGATSGGNVIANNQFANVSTRITDAGTDTKMETLNHRATANPTSNDDITKGYGVGTIWINTSTENAWVSVVHTSGSAVWKQIDGGNLSWANLPVRSKEIGLAPEYPDAVLQADTTNNVGSMTAGYDSVNLHNYYNWTSSQGTLQDYDIVTRIKLPQDFDSWDASNPITFNYKTSDASTANNKLDIYLLDTTNTVASLTGNTGLASASWATYSSTNNLSGGTWTPGQFITVKVRCYGLTGKSAQAGEITLKYNGK